MKQKFSRHWKSSKQPRKQRKYLANAPLNVKRKMLSANLSKELRKKYGKRNFPVRKDDEVKIMCGKERGKKGKVNGVNINKHKISIEGIQKKKKEGSKINLWFDVSNIQIQELNLNDKERIKSLNRKATNIENIEKKGEKKGK